MPRLGLDDTVDEEGRPLINRRVTATAYAAVSGNASAGQQLLAIRLLLFFMVTLIARNALVRDYREDAREYLLKVSGKSEDEIDRYFIPKTAAEKQQSAIKQKVSSEQLHETVATLEKEVDRLKWKVFGSNTTDDKKASAKD